MRLLSTAPPLVTGAPLEGEAPWIGILIPVARQNIIANPSPQRAITGYTLAGSATIARTSGAGRRGAYGVRVTPTSASGDGVYYGTVSLVSGTAYALSVDLKGVPGQTYELSLRTTGGASLNAIQVQASGLWERVWLPYVETSTTTRRVYLTKIGTGTGIFDTDGWQVEPCGSDGTFPTTYLDGAQRGLVPNELPPPYGWLGTPYASTSYRTGQTRAGGRELMLREFSFLLLSIIGLGLVTPQLDAIPYSQLDGGNFQRARKPDRQFTLTGRFDAASLPELMANRAALATLLDRDLVAREQPLVLTIQPHDDATPIGDKVQVPALYAGGLGGVLDSQFAESAPVTFRQFLPYIIGPDAGAALNVQSTINTTGLIRRAVDGTWSGIATGSGGVGDRVQAMVRGLDGRIYIGGDFTDFGGSGADYLVIYDPTAGTFSVAQSATALNGVVYTMAALPDGRILVGGNFTNAGGVANADYIAIYDPVGNSYSAPGGIAGANAQVLALAVLSDGTWYAGGAFTDIGGSGADYLAYFNGATYAVVGSATALSDFVSSLTLSLDQRYLYLAGNFTNAGGVTGATGIARWDRTGLTYAVVGGAPNASRPQALARGPDGTIYAGTTTTLTSIGGVSVLGVGAWDGSQWRSLMVGVTNAEAAQLTVLQDGRVLAWGRPFRTDTTFPELLGIWNGAAWLPVPLDFTTNPSFRGQVELPDGTLFLGLGTNAFGVASGITSVVNTGGARTYPRVTLRGPTTGSTRIYELVNTTTNRAVYFDLTISAGETIVLTFEPDNLTFVSDFQGDLTTAIVPGSQQADFFLQPGANTIACFVGDSSATATMEWRTLYVTLDEAVPTP